VNAYHNGLVYDSTGRLHVSWTWRTGGDSTTGFTDYQSNHNVMYAYSENDGVDWRLANGTLLSRNTVHDIDEANATPVINLPDGSSIINQSSTAVGQTTITTWPCGRMLARQPCATYRGVRRAIGNPDHESSRSRRYTIAEAASAAGMARRS
jgi:hypothetical protein